MSFVNFLLVCSHYLNHDHNKPRNFQLEIVGEMLYFSSRTVKHFLSVLSAFKSRFANLITLAKTLVSCNLALAGKVLQMA